MNPILLKPTSDLGAQVVVWGKPYRMFQAREYQFHTSTLAGNVKTSLKYLMDEYEVVVIEGAGSPAEINLQAHDIVNMLTADMADAPVLLVGDIDRGGVFASFVGTWELLSPAHRQRIKAFLINKFRGDESLLLPGFDFLLGRTGIPTLGVIPYESHLDILEEDGLSDERIKRNGKDFENNKIVIDVIWLPRISNQTDFHPFDFEKNVSLVYQREVPDRFPDVCVIPGTKSTMADLHYLRAKGFDRWIQKCIDHGVLVMGICGGYQMLGEKILDPYCTESEQAECSGLGIVPAVTQFQAEKVTQQVSAFHIESGIEVKGYEIHMGTTRFSGPSTPLFRVTQRSGQGVNFEEGIDLKEKNILGTYLHGIFESKPFRNFFINQLRLRKGLLPVSVRSFESSKQDAYNQLADLIRSHIDLDLFYHILNREAVLKT